MAVINGTSGNDNFVGTTADDVMYAGDGRDYVNGGAGNDIIYGEAGNDTLTGDAGNDILYGGEGNDGFYGGGGDDQIFGGNGADNMFGDGGNDILDGGASNDILTGSGGNDTLVVRIGEGIDTLNGGAGSDTIRLEMSSTQLTGAVRADLATLNAWMGQQLAAAGGNAATLVAQTTGLALTLNAIGITANTFEQVVVIVDGVPVPLVSLLNDAPVAAATVAVATSEDTAISGQIDATDANGDLLGWSVQQGPAHGSVLLDAATGAYTYTPAGDFSGADAFTVRIADPSGAFAEQQVNLTIAAVADAPALNAVSLVVGVSQSLTGTTAADTIMGGAGDDVIAGGDGNDSLSGDGAGFVRVLALDVSAVLADTDGSETLSIHIAGLPDDGILSAGVANSDGSWTLSPAELSGLTLSTATTTNFALAIEATAAEAAGGAAITTASLAVTFDVGAGGNDTIDAGAGDDIANGGVGNDRLIDGTGNDTMNGGTGDDRFVAGLGNDRYDGGDGFDTLDFTGSATAITADLSRGTATGLGTEKIVNIEGLAGSVLADVLTGSKFANTIDGGAGNDRIVAGAGNDGVFGGAGNDTLDGGSGNDTISDGAGNDTVRGGSGNDHFLAGQGNDRYIGGSGFDTLDYTLADSAVTIDVSKKTVAGFTNDTIDGVEKIIGSAFADSYKGSSRADNFDGGAGDDVIRGLGGTDILTGGAGNDTFVWLQKDVVSGSKHLGIDTITDFGPGDRVDLHDFLKSARYSSINDVVHVTDSADGAMLSVKMGNTFVDVAKLAGFHEDNAADMLAAGMILA